jgi:dihydrofolate reductase
VTGVAISEREARLEELFAAGWTTELFSEFWAASDLKWIPSLITDDVVAYWPGGRIVRGKAEYHPVFVLTQHAPEPVKMQGGTTFYFVTDGIQSAFDQAKEAAASKGVSLGGEATAVQQYLAAGLLDEMLISVVPVFLGDGARLFDNLGDDGPKLEQVEVVEAPGVTHIRYRVG